MTSGKQSEIKLLGFCIDENLKFAAHINEQCMYVREPVKKSGAPNNCLL